VFVETESDKRNRLYKKLGEVGRVTECAKPPESDLIKWLMNVFAKKNKTISRENAVKLLRFTQYSMTSLHAEAGKLGDYTGDRREITGRDIDEVCVPPLEARVFDMIAKTANGQTHTALQLYKDMLHMKEQPVKVLAMMARQFRLMYHAKMLAVLKKKPAEIAAELGLRGFVADECLRQGRRFTPERLLAAMSDCRDTDIRVKTGQMEAETGVELLIVRYSSNP
jgi:DNA polymerase-3 subunit delta